MCNKAVEVGPWQLKDVPNHFKKQKIWIDGVRRDPYSLQFVPDSLVTQQQIDIWYDDDEYCDDDGVIKWYQVYQKRRAQKAKIKEELLPIAWHPSRW